MSVKPLHAISSFVSSGSHTPCWATPASVTKPVAGRSASTAKPSEVAMPAPPASLTALTLVNQGRPPATGFGSRMYRCKVAPELPAATTGSAPTQAKPVFRTGAGWTKYPTTPGPAKAPRATSAASCVWKTLAMATCSQPPVRALPPGVSLTPTNSCWTSVSWSDTVKRTWMTWKSSSARLSRSTSSAPGPSVMEVTTGAVVSTVNPAEHCGARAMLPAPLMGFTAQT